MEITKREIIVSISILAVMLIMGVFIGNKISETQMDNNSKYNNAINIEDSELFKYGMATNVGNAFVYGELKAVDSVTYEGVEGEYLYIKKETERYTEHTRTVTTGKTSHTETYYTWDTVNTDSKQSKKINFCEVEFNTSQFKLPSDSYITTININSKLRDKYYGVKSNLKGTIFAKLYDNNIPKSDVHFYNDNTISQALDNATSNGGLIIFWIVWIIIIGGIIYGFYYLDNKWLD
jgi:hypothetical protein